MSTQIRRPSLTTLGATLAAGLAGLGGIGLLGAPSAAGAAIPRPPAPLHGVGTAGALPGRYIVVLKGSAVTRDGSTPATARAARVGVRVERRFGRALHGFAAALSGAQLTALRADPDVAYVEADQVVHADATETPAPWGLDRIDQRALPLDSSYTSTPTGAGVTAYVIDTGIRATHLDFAGRVTAGFTAIQDGNITNDCNGHGTHVAGTIGGASFGVAKGVKIVPVRVLDCSGSGTVSGVIAGIDWVTANHGSPSLGPAVANLSLGGGVSQALDDAVTASIASGVTYTVAAGNTATDACAGSPARVPAALTVGATTSADSRDTRYSDIGPCLDLFAPGTNITSDWNTSDTATNTISGTSMAAPHLAGVAALYLQDHPGASPADVAAAITSSATPNVLANVGSGSPNLLLYSGLTAPAGGGGGGGGAGGTGPCAMATVTYTGTLSGTGASQIQPGGGYYTSAVAGTHIGCLTGPAGADFDLYLYRWNGRAWVIVAGSDGTTSTETVTYSGAAGSYFWRVVAYRGSGFYALKTARP